MIDLINPYVAKILIALKSGDSIRQVSKKTNISYGWTHFWIERLEDEGILKRKGQEIIIDEKNTIYAEFLKFIKKALKEKISLADAYSLPALSGLEYAFTSTDAVFIWTKGGYNIGRSAESYPIFIEVLKSDLEKWKKFFSEFSVNSYAELTKRKGIYFIMFPKDYIIKEEAEGIAVKPLKETVEWATKYIYNFQPALEMLDEMYKLNFGVRYAE